MEYKNLSADWICANADEPENSQVRVFAKEFECRKPVRAVLYVVACGVYEAKINGKPVSEDLLRPGWTNYRKRIQVQEYDVTGKIAAHNRIELTVAPGWWAGYLNGEGKNHHYGDRVAVWAVLQLMYEDTDICSRETVPTERIATDLSWTCSNGSIVSSELYHGEMIDARIGIHSEQSVQQPVRLFDLPYPTELVPQIGPSVRVIKRLQVKQMMISPKGERILDFGQNIAGVVELRVKGSAGQKITLRHAEVLDRNGNFYIANLRTARAEDTLICSGGEDCFCPKFTFHGFRYVKVEGLEEQFDNGLIGTDAFTACAISSVQKKTADFHCSNDLVNQLWSNINWSMADNFVDLPTDCPQRDERLGWTGDAAIFSGTAGQLFDTYDFFRKWLKDLAGEQSVKYGLPDTIPNILMPPETPSGGSAVWGDACTLVPWSQYRLYGDPTVLEAQYESMKNWVEYIRRTETPDHLHKSGHQRGDWLAMDREEGKGMSGSTDPYLISTAFYAESTRILAESARILGKNADAEEYRRLYEEIVKGFQDEFITKNGRVVSETQTALSLILCLGLADEERKKTIADSLARNLTNHKNRITTGFIGTPYLMKALSISGHHDLAVKVLLNEDCPGWLNEVKLGATTIWERWDSMHADGTFDESGMNSFNHYSFGAVGSWMIEELAGIEAKEPGYKVISFHPSPAYGLTEVSAMRETPYGKASCAWICKDGQITVKVTVPENTTAELQLPEQEGLITLIPGTYDYAYATDTRTEPLRYTMDSTMAELTGCPAFVEAAEQLMPGMSQNLQMDFVQKKTLSELSGMMPAGAASFFEGILRKMNQ